jgi:RNA polymerase sigma-70 factor (ECF subfamily)
VEPATQPSLPTDADVARRVAAGGEEAAESEAELCRRYLNRARLYGLKHLRFDVTAAEDLAQQVMVVVLEALRAGRVEDLDRIDRFMLGTCRNVAHSMYRREKRVVETEKRLFLESAQTVTPPWEMVVTRRVEDCLAQLKPRESQLLTLLFQEGATAAEAAKSLGTTAGNIRVLHHRAIARLRECVEGPSGGMRA